MHKKIIFFGFIIAIGLGSIVSTMTPEMYSGGSPDYNSSKIIGGTLALFILSVISLYVVAYLYKLIIKPLLIYIGTDFQKGKNFFEKIFYSKILGPAIEVSTKDAIIKNIKGRLLVLLYSIVYIIFFVFFIIIAGIQSDDTALPITFIFLILIIIPYRLLIPTFISTFNYIKGEK